MNRDEATEKLQEIIGKDLVEIAETCGVTLFKDGKKNKGWVGHVVECHLGLPRNCLQSPDFGDWELKTVSMKKLKSGLIVPKETMAIRMWYATSEPHSELLSAFQFDIDKNQELYSEIEADYEETRDCLKTKGFNALTGKMGKWIQPRTKGQGNGAPKTRAFYARTSFLKRILQDKD